MSMIGVGLLGWLFTLQQEPGIASSLHYGFLILALAGFYMIGVNKLPKDLKYKKYLKILFIVIGFYLISWYKKHDYYQIRWTNEKGDEYLDTYKRSNSKDVQERSVSFKNGDSARGSFVNETEMKKHGRWIYVGADYHVEYEYYWYGEEISEGEWFLRNK